MEIAGIEAPMTDKKETTHFGFEQVQTDEKAERVSNVFHSVADGYDVMNDFMSLGIHRYWKAISVMAMNVRVGQHVLDVAAGSGDLSKKLANRVGPKGSVCMLDIQWDMLRSGQDRMIDVGLIDNIYLVQGNAECLPFADNTFDRITIAFGLRNVTHIPLALESMYRILKPGGQLMVLEFSEVKPILRPLYDWYSFNVVPKIGGFVLNDEDSYRYLVESIRMHPDQETLKSLMVDAGFEQCQYRNFSMGIVACHQGTKY